MHLLQSSDILYYSHEETLFKGGEFFPQPHTRSAEASRETCRPEMTVLVTLIQGVVQYNIVQLPALNFPMLVLLVGRRITLSSTDATPIKRC